MRKEEMPQWVLNRQISVLHTTDCEYIICSPSKTTFAFPIHEIGNHTNFINTFGNIWVRVLFYRCSTRLKTRAHPPPKMEKLEFAINRTSAAEPFFLFSHMNCASRTSFASVCSGAFATLNNEQCRVYMIIDYTQMKKSFSNQIK